MNTILHHEDINLTLTLKQSECTNFYLLETQITNPRNVKTFEDLYTQVEIFFSYIKAIKSFFKAKEKSEKQDTFLNNQNSLKKGEK